MIKAKVDFDNLITQFGIKVSKENRFLSEWLQPETEKLDDFSEESLARIEPRLALEINGWLEEELKMNLLSPILLLSELHELEKIGVFFERQISATIDDVFISVKTDCMISSVLGLTTPKTPYFFMQEFKKSKGDKQDPEGQMLAAMIAAQYLNKNGKPIYGAYVVGAFWYFTILDGKNYTRNEALRLTQPLELRQVILTLRKLKQIILNDLFD